MLYQRGKITVTKVGQPYVSNWQHRDGNPKKSQWTINQGQEIGVFEYSYKSNWVSQRRDKRSSWGLYMTDGMIFVLGRTARECELPLRDVRIAKFIEDRQAWHGYPANYRCNKQDRPDTKILESWHKCGYIRKNEIKKIRNMKPCAT